MTTEKDNVHILDMITRLDLPPDRVLSQAEGKLTSVLVVGWDNDDDIYVASSLADGGALLWLIEKAKQQLLMAGERD